MEIIYYSKISLFRLEYITLCAVFSSAHAYKHRAVTFHDWW